MKISFRSEWERLVQAARQLEGQTVFVLIAAVLLMFVQYTLGSRTFFREEMAYLVASNWQGVAAWGWWFGMQCLTGFVVPAAALLFFFRCRPADIGLGAGDWQFGLLLAFMYLPLVVAGTWILSNDLAFQAGYPHYQPAARDWKFFAVYEGLFLLYWVGWEYLWRGFVLFGTVPTFGYHAIFVQMVPFALLHLDKPPAEMLLSIAGGLALGALVWRCRSFWIAVPIHAAQMMILDFWCTLRIRTGASGVGLSALLEALGG